MQISLQLSSFPRNSPRPPTPADRIEALFFQEILKNAGLESRESSFSGSTGEAQFASFLTAEYGRILAGRIDLGLDRIGGSQMP